ncbi:MAG: hypothetical protein OXT64_06835, partial [Gammaproteobacteria bacterium]|nr:hypothetical protein [Gammaproteobacteria bacterium]
MMKMTLMLLMVLGMAGAGFSTHAEGGEALAPGLQEQQPAQESADADNLYDLVKQARADLREMRVTSGLSAYASGPQAGRPESHEGGEGTYLSKMTKQDKLFANGARLVLEFDPATQVFAGSVTNSTARALPQVRVEVHLDNGTELGPTRCIDVAPGETVPVELGAFGNEFNAWVSHPEAGVEEGHGEGAEEGGEAAGEHGGREGRGEHGGGETARPRGAAYRPVYNQLQILRGEMHAFRSD